MGIQCVEQPSACYLFALNEFFFQDQLCWNVLWVMSWHIFFFLPSILKCLSMCCMLMFSPMKWDSLFLFHSLTSEYFQGLHNFFPPAHTPCEIVDVEGRWSWVCRMWLKLDFFYSILICFRSFNSFEWHDSGLITSRKYFQYIYPVHLEPKSVTCRTMGVALLCALLNLLKLNFFLILGCDLFGVSSGLKWPLLQK